MNRLLLVVRPLTRTTFIRQSTTCLIKPSNDVIARHYTSTSSTSSKSNDNNNNKKKLEYGDVEDYDVDDNDQQNKKKQQHQQQFKAKLRSESKKEEKEKTTRKTRYRSPPREMETWLKGHMKKFLVKVHPDVLHDKPDLANTNQRSLTLLNNLLRNRDAYIRVHEGSTTEMKLEAIPTTISLSFHHQTTTPGQIVQIGHFEHEMTFDVQPLDLASSKSALADYVLKLRLDIYAQMFAVFQKADITIPPHELQELAQLLRPEDEGDAATESFDDPWDETFESSIQEGEDGLSITQLMDEFIMQNNVTTSRITAELSLEQSTLLQLFNENKIFFYYGEQIKGDMNVMRSLGKRRDAELQILHLKGNLEQLEFSSWHQLPILIAMPQYVDQLRQSLATSNFVVLPRDFDPVETLSYIKEEVPDMVEGFKALYSVSKNNLSILERSADELKSLLGANSVTVENLYSMNQRTMKSSKLKFSKARAALDQMGIPVTKLIEEVRAQQWTSLPETKLGQVPGRLKLSGAKLHDLNALIAQYGGRQSAPDKSKSSGSASTPPPSPSTSSDLQEQQYDNFLDLRYKPLTIVNPNTFNYLESAPHIGSAMECITKLREMVNTEHRVPMAFPDPNVDEYEHDDSDGNGSSAYLRHRKPTDLLATSVDADHNPQTMTVDVVSNFTLPVFGNNPEPSATAQEQEQEQKQSHVKTTSKQQSSSRQQQQQQRPTIKETKIVAQPKQRLADFGWANLHLVLSDHYQFIMSPENDMAYIYIPINFTETELLLFLNANYNKISTIQKEFYAPVLESTDLVLKMQLVESMLQSIKERHALSSVKIDGAIVKKLPLQYKAVKQLRANMASISNEEANALRAIGPNIDIIIGAKDVFVEYHDQSMKQATIYLPSKLVDSIPFGQLIDHIYNESAYFRRILSGVPYHPSVEDEQELQE
ncbi:hypothetical protein SAMD00019534_065470 [Acytostelium subglobosum LB1]|uniref:hypothetical protein n=1 Tax=Acytostelium subglobosum LB1 TaxID=1410327 RepID=UPI0006451412|nr:hypothetical protein SAMD00019534_065470 [Acytostelium subglobosum LB1]GAM23372.1 hypothetical protein SAMD00019534_065470 [Acytostelium subglobosum LB1]|eukprot:XP_012753821.1 hypothetical protein SAMD00019534_065470 [Acytostelium subglobosum LB1]